MKNSTAFAAILMFLAASVGALVAAALYLRRREKELDEYEEMLFSEDFSEEDGEMPAPQDEMTAEEAAEEAETIVAAPIEDASAE